MGEVLEEKKLGLTGFQLKVIGLIVMVFDHMQVYLDFMNPPIWFKWLGRIAAPIFIFMTVEGYVHTRNKKKYMGRLYIGYVLMSFGNNLIVNMFPREPVTPIINSMFGSLFLVLLYLNLFDAIKNGYKEKDIKKLLVGIIGMTLPIIINSVFLILIGNGNMPIAFMRVFTSLFPLPLLVEGGMIYVLIGLVFYIFRDKMGIKLLLYIGISLLLGRSQSLTLDSLLYGNYQWMMIFAAPLIYLYSGEEGRKMKSFFYFFYPAHVYILYIIGSIFSNR